MFNDWISRELDIEKLRKGFRKGKPFEHVIVKNFLKEEKAGELARALKKADFVEKESDLFSFWQTNDLYFSKNKTLKNFNKDFLCWEWFNFVGEIVGGEFEGEVDMAGTCYKDGDYLLCHDDELSGRKVAYVLYLSKDFEKGSGGEFCLYSSRKGVPNKIEKKILPLFNHLLLFEVSEKSFHSVAENLSKKNRYAISGWLH